MVSSLLDEPVDYFLGLAITFLLQVSDERVQMAWTVVRLYYWLMGLHNASDTCERKPAHGWRERAKKNSDRHAQSVFSHLPAAALACLQISAELSSHPDLLQSLAAGSPQLWRQAVRKSVNQNDIL